MRKPVILLIDNDPIVLASFSGNLASEGYRVLVAESEEEALRWANHEVVHVAVIDVRLINDRDENDYSGLRLAVSLGLLSIFKVILTGQPYSDPGEIVRRVLAPDMQGNVLGSNFIWKHEGPEKVLEAIRIALHKDIKFNPNLKVTPKNISWGMLVSQLKMFRDSAPEIKQQAEIVLDDLTCRLFHESDEVRFGRTLQGHSHCTVVLAQQVSEGGAGTHLAVKFGPRANISQEAKNYEKYVKPKVPSCATLQLGPVWSCKMGAIAYSFVGEQGSLVKAFLDYYADKHISTEQIRQLLSHLFDESCKYWYEGKRRPEESERKPLDILYRTDLNLLDAPHIAKLKSRCDFLLHHKPRGNASIQALNDGALHVQIAERPPLTLPDPIRFVFDEHNSETGSDFFPTPSQVAITHGDMHSGNIIVGDGGRNTWLIDFYKTGWGHVLRDFAELESDVKFTLLQADSLRDRYDLEQALLAPQSLNEPLDGLLKRPTAAQTRALETIQNLRELAYRITETERVREYHIALLFFALKQIVSFTSAEADGSTGSVAQYHALLSAAMICRRLEAEAYKENQSTEATMKIFLSYASEDKTQVDGLYQQLAAAGYTPWIDHRDIVPGEDWLRAIGKAVRGSQVFIACLSPRSARKRGFVQKEIRQAIEIYDGMLPEDIFLIPVMLEDCEMPERLEKLQAIRLYQPDSWDQLVKAIEVAKERQSK